MPVWIDTHAHLDAPELRGAWQTTSESGQVDGGLNHAIRRAGVRLSVIPAVSQNQFDVVRDMAHAHGDAYALGVHPLTVGLRSASELQTELTELNLQLERHRSDPRLVAVGEIGLDFFVPALCTPPMRQLQEQVYRAQLKLARAHGLPVLLHVRRSADVLLKHLRQVWHDAPNGHPPEGLAGIAHAFNGSDVQASAFLQMGIRLGFGGAVTFEAAKRLRHLAATLPPQAIVMETDAPDIPPQWLYATAAQRDAGEPQGINTPAELPRIGSVVAGLRGVSSNDWAVQTTANAMAALPRLYPLLGMTGGGT